MVLWFLKEEFFHVKSPCVDYFNSAFTSCIIAGESGSSVYRWHHKITLDFSRERWGGWVGGWVGNRLFFSTIVTFGHLCALLTYIWMYRVRSDLKSWFIYL